ncbi:hypothetical protein ACFQZS_10365 [Mucilaginibacter calamicampi]|uniref:Uncharacterized protein n=1 Tax=Mucilaginibacter calamicampi TaxID=1302352 RepID=A0ABW2YVQ7_9SPHI
MHFRISILLFFIAIGACSCKKSGNKPEEKKEADVYVAGHTATHIMGSLQTEAAYWKNGSINLLEKKGIKATDIAVQGNDVYVSGYRYTNDGQQRACYWKNGICVDLESTADFPSTTAIAVKGTDVYVLGGDQAAVCWKNGIKTNLIPPLSTPVSIEDIAILGDDIYMSGIKITGDIRRAIYIKNGVINELPSLTNSADPNLKTYAAGITVSGNDIYIAGDEGINFEDGTVVYWKNGAVVPVAKRGSAKDIFVNGADIYIVGTKFGPSSLSNNQYATIWKNGAEYSTSANDSQFLNAVLHQDDIYTISKGGYEYALYKNGIEQQFSNVPAVPIKVVVISK